MLIGSARNALGDALCGVYLFGSAVMGDFESASSDIDFLAITKGRPSHEQVDRLVALHRHLADRFRWGGRLEGGYAARHQVRAAGIVGGFIAVDPGGVVRNANAADFTAENMLAIREHSVALYGPPPRSVIPSVDAMTLKAALRDYLAILVKRTMQAGAMPPGNSPTAADLSAWVLNMARCVYGLQVEECSTKSEAASWVARKLPEVSRVLAAALAVRRGNNRGGEEGTLREGLRDYGRAVTLIG